MKAAAHLTILGGLIVGTALNGFAATSEWEINVVGDMTEAGRKLTPPTREHPAIYVPMVLGFREGAAPAAGEKLPPQDDVLRQVAKALLQQGYIVVGANRPEPTLLLLFSWGSLNPVEDQTTLEVEGLEMLDASSGQPLNVRPVEQVQSRGSLTNAKEMRALVAGKTVENIAKVPAGMTNKGLEEVRADMIDDRYFVTVVAFDWRELKEHKKKVMLWSTKMSVPSRRTTLVEVVPALIKSGGPFFGRETQQAQRVIVPVREGRVEVGTPEVVKSPADATAQPGGGKK